MSNELINNVKKEFEKAIEHLKNEYRVLQVGRAQTGLVDSIEVDAYGVPTIMKGVATVSTPDAKTIMIQPWDKNLLGVIEKAILASELGLNPQNDGVLIRIVIPDLTEERRLSLKKIVRERAEEAKISLRNDRQKVHNELKKLKEAGDITEDDLYSLNDELQKVMKEFTDNVDHHMKEKEDDIMKV